MKKIKISIIVPCYKCADSLEELYSRLVMTLNSISKQYEIILINDGSPDNDWNQILKLCNKDNNVVGINLSRNFGQHYAITAGLDYCRGEWIVVMDGDLQDQPEEIIKLYNKAIEGFDIVVGKRPDRKDNFFKKITSRMFFKIFNYLSGSKIKNSIGNFGIYSKKVIDNVNKIREKNRSFGLFVLWVGFKRIEIDIIHSKRPVGKSGYSFNKLIGFAIDSIIAHSNRLLVISILIGLLFSFCSLFISFGLVLRYLFLKISVEGWTSLMVSIYFLTGLLLSSLGIIGLYVGKVFDETKNRPLYVITELIDNHGGQIEKK